MWLCMRKQKFTFLRIASLTDSVHVHGLGSILLSLLPLRKSWHLLGHFRTLWAFKQTSHCLSFRRPFYPTLTCHVNTWSLLPTLRVKVTAVARSARPFSTIFFLWNLFFHIIWILCVNGWGGHLNQMFCLGTSAAIAEKWKRRLDVITGCRAAKPLQGSGFHMPHLKIWIPFPWKGFFEKWNLSVHGITIALAVIFNDVSLWNIPSLHAFDCSFKALEFWGSLTLCVYRAGVAKAPKFMNDSDMFAYR